MYSPATNGEAWSQREAEEACMNSKLCGAPSRPRRRLVSASASAARGDRGRADNITS